MKLFAGLVLIVVLGGCDGPERYRAQEPTMAAPKTGLNVSGSARVGVVYSG